MPVTQAQPSLFQHGELLPNSLTPSAPSYHELQVNIQQQDCLTFLHSLPAQSVDILVTDPAYAGMNNKLKLGRGRIVGKYGERGTENGKWFHEFEDTPENYHQFLAECRRVLKPDTGHIYIMFDSFSLLTLGALMREYFEVKNLITWDKVNIGMGHYYRRRHEYIIFATSGNNRKLRSQTFPDVWRFKRLTRAEYPTQKPVELFQTMIYASGELGFTVCDPFTGSGSAAVAAVKNQCHFVGGDISAEAVALATQRVQHFLETGLDMLQPKPAHVDGEDIFWE